MTRDIVPVIALGAITILGWLWLLIDNREMRARLHRHRTELNGHARHLTWLTGAIDTPPSKAAPMPKVSRVERWPATGFRSGAIDWGDVLPPDHVQPSSIRPAPVRPLDRWSVQRPDHGDTLTMPHHDTLQLLATTTLRLRPPTVLPPADVLDALHRTGQPMTRQELAETLERDLWDLTAELRDLVHAGRITIAQFTHGTDAAYIPTGAHQ